MLLLSRVLRSHPVWVRGLKLMMIYSRCAPTVSHPVWVRGLKLIVFLVFWISQRSHPVWVRGLKQKNSCIFNKFVCVAPRVGAWIETLLQNSAILWLPSHPVWVRGLKLLSSVTFSRPLQRRTPCGCVD